MLTVFLALGSTFNANAQREKPKNLPNFDSKRLHFGFLLGYGSASFYMNQKPDFSFEDSLLVLEVKKQPGFSLGIVSELHLNKNIGVRFLPSLSFQDRALHYTFLEADSSLKFTEKRVESTFLDFPINLKLRTDRVNNFAAYIVTGAKYSMDMASQQDVNNAVSDDITVKIRKNDISAEIGGGTDFFLKYFKFGIELKLSVGLNNVLVPENTKWSAPISKLRTRMVHLTFTFEG